MGEEYLKEWLILQEEDIKYHKKQCENPYRSTVKFFEFLCKNLKPMFPSNYICDLGCGAGANLHYILSEGKDLFRGGKGFDINPYVIEIGKELASEKKAKNCEFEVADILQLDKKWVGKFDGVISLQTVLLFPDYREIIKAMCSLDPSWIAFSTLGFEGMIDYKIKLLDYTKKKGGEYAEVYYNILSLPIVEEYFRELGYNHFYYEEFEIDIDLPKMNNLGRGTYTVKSESGKRIQVSGGMMMPWYFVFVRK